MLKTLTNLGNIMYKISKNLRESATEKLYKAKKEWLRSPQQRNGNICWGSILNLDGEEPVRIYSECHRWVTDAFNRICGVSWAYSFKSKEERFLTLTCTPKGQKNVSCSDGAIDALILWIARDSPFSKYVVNRKDTDSLLSGGIVLACGHNGLTAAQAMWVCKVIRYAIEADKALDVWFDLYSKGINPLFALAVCTFVKTIKGATFGLSPRDSHSAVFGDTIDPADLFRGEPCGYAMDTSCVFGSRFSVSLKLSLEAFCKPAPISDGWGGFTPSRGEVSKQEFYEKILNWENELTKKELNS